MRLAFVASTPYPHLGGQSTHIADLTRGLRAAGHEIHHVSQADIAPAVAKNAVHRPAYALDKAIVGAGRRWSYPLLERLLASKVRALADRVPLDAVLAQDPIALLAVRRALGRRVPVLLTVHGYLVMEHLADGNLKPGGIADWLQGREDAAYLDADAVVTVDTRIKDHLLARGVDAGRITVLLNFVDTERFSPGPPDGRWPGRFVVAVPRRLVAKNGVKYAVEAAGRLGDPFLVVVAGDGPQRAELEAMRPVACEMLGPLAHDALPGLLRRADVVAVPSVHEKGVEEATSIAALEAMAAGRPVVASAIGGLKELIRDDENGLLVPERDADALASAVRRLREDPALARRLAERARRDVLDRFSLGARVQDYVAAIEKARRAANQHP